MVGTASCQFDEKFAHCYYGFACQGKKRREMQYLEHSVVLAAVSYPPRDEVIWNVSCRLCRLLLHHCADRRIYDRTEQCRR